jgi:hypothetical protein
LSIKTWGDLRDAYNTGYPMKEESITDFLLLELQRSHPNEVVVRPFSRYIEGRSTGADWEWWFESGGVYLGMRVQARILDGSDLTYKGLFKSNNKCRCRQVNKLLQSAKRANLPAIYCFYNFWPKGMYESVWNCPTFHPRDEYLGCAIADAVVIRNIIKHKSTQRLADIQPICNPWMCLVCCEGYSRPGDSLPYRVQSFVKVLLRRKHELPEQDTEGAGMIEESLLPKVTEKPPDYVLRVKEKQILAFPDDKEYQKRLKGLRGVILVSEKPDHKLKRYNERNTNGPVV